MKKQKRIMQIREYENTCCCFLNFTENKFHTNVKLYRPSFNKIKFHFPRQYTEGKLNFITHSDLSSEIKDRERPVKHDRKND